MAMLQIQFFSRSLRREVALSALVPLDTPPIPGQPVEEAKPLKALYLLHGYSGNHTDWIHFSRIRELSDKYKIAVFMPSGKTISTLTMRTRVSYTGNSLGGN